MSASPPSFLFIPVSGPGGAGEFHRSLALAHAFEHRWPGSRILFVLNRLAPYAASAPYPCLLLDDSPTRRTAEVAAFIDAQRPDAVIFDSSGRLAQYRAARAAGAAVVYVSSRPKTRWKGFRWERMRLFDQHWIVEPEHFGTPPGPYERLKLWLVGRPEIVFLGPPYDEPGADDVAALQARLGLQPGRYVVLCPGGGGDFGDGRDGAAEFAEAARRLREAQPLPVVAVLGPRHGEPSSAEPCTLSALPNGVLMGLIRGAAIAAVNGGSLLLQSMSQGTPLVAAPVAGDQAARIRRSARLGCAVPASLRAESIVAAVLGLLDDPSAAAAMRTELERVGPSNGAVTATQAMARLLDSRRA